MKLIKYLCDQLFPAKEESVIAGFAVSYRDRQNRLQTWFFPEELAPEEIGLGLPVWWKLVEIKRTCIRTDRPGRIIKLRRST